MVTKPAAAEPRLKWTAKEDVLLAEAWKTVSLDAIVGANQNMDNYWKRVKSAYDEQRMIDPDFHMCVTERGQKAMANHWAIHGDHGHHTDECIALRKEVARLLSLGHLQDVISDKAKATLSRRDQVTSERPPSPVPAKVINTISGGSELCGISYSSAKRHAKSAILDSPPASESVEKKDSHTTPISFDDSDACEGEHHDGLVISLSIGNCLIR